MVTGPADVAAVKAALERFEGETSLDHLLPAWEALAVMPSRPYARLRASVLAWSVAALGMAIVTATWPGVLAGVLTSIAVGRAAFQCARWIPARRSDRRRARAAYERWLETQTRAEASRALLEMATARLRATGQESARLPTNDEVRRMQSALMSIGPETAKDIQSVLLDFLNARADEIASDATVVLRSRVRELEATLAVERVSSARRNRTRGLFDSTSLKVQIWTIAHDGRLVHRGAARAPFGSALDVQAVTPAEPEALLFTGSNPPAFSADVSSVLRGELERAVRDAEDGRVVQSPAAAYVLSERARWSAYAAPIRWTRELQELFDPSLAERPDLRPG